MTDREVMQMALEALEGVLCDPEGKCCIDGSDADRAIVDATITALRAALAEREQATPEQIDAARQLYAEGSEGDIAVDDDALVSSTETGAWVQAWVFVSNEEVKA